MRIYLPLVPVGQAEATLARATIRVNRIFAYNKVHLMSSLNTDDFDTQKCQDHSAGRVGDDVGSLEDLFVC